MTYFVPLLTSQVNGINGPEAGPGTEKSVLLMAI